MAVDALSERKGSVDELEAWIRTNLDGLVGGVVCGDLGYAYGEDALALWAKYTADPPLNYEKHE